MSYRFPDATPSRRHLLDAVQVLLTQLYIRGERVFLEPCKAARARDGDHVCVPCEEPGQRQLRRCALPLVREQPDLVGHRDIPRKVLSLEPRVVPPPVVRRKLVERPKPAGKKSPAQWAVCDERDAQLVEQRWYQLVFRIASPQSEYSD